MIKMKNFKTSLAGLIAGTPFILDALIQAYNAGTFTNKSGTQLLAAIGVVLLGLYSKDHDVKGL
jgi:hypothetical protein